MPRKSANPNSSSAARARKRKTASATATATASPSAVMPTTVMPPTSPTAAPVSMPAPPAAADSVSSGLVEKARQAATAHTQPLPDFPEPSQFAPSDPQSASANIPRVADEVADEQLTAIKEQSNTVKIMQANAKLTGEVEALRGVQAQAMQKGVSAAKSIEGITTAIEQYDVQVIGTQLSREQKYQKTMELAGLEATRELVDREIQAKRQLKLNRIAKAEAQAARVLAGTVDTPSEHVDY